MNNSTDKRLLLLVVTYIALIYLIFFCTAQSSHFDNNKPFKEDSLIKNKSILSFGHMPEMPRVAKIYSNTTHMNENETKKSTAEHHQEINYRDPNTVMIIKIHEPQETPELKTINDTGMEPLNAIPENEIVIPPNDFPSNEAESEARPRDPPSASSGQSSMYLFHGQKPSMEDLRLIGGDLAIGNGLQFFILYNNKWCQEYTSYWYADRTNTLWYVDLPQQISLYEKYPDGHVAQKEIGSVDIGYYPGWFEADTKGWHKIAIWGSKSGWSNELEIYVQ